MQAHQRFACRVKIALLEGELGLRNEARALDSGASLLRALEPLVTLAGLPHLVCCACGDQSGESRPDPEIAGQRCILFCARKAPLESVLQGRGKGCPPARAPPARSKGPDVRRQGQCMVQELHRCVQQHEQQQ